MKTNETAQSETENNERQNKLIQNKLMATVYNEMVAELTTGDTSKEYRQFRLKPKHKNFINDVFIKKLHETKGVYIVGVNYTRRNGLFISGFVKIEDFLK